MDEFDNSTRKWKPDVMFIGPVAEILGYEDEFSTITHRVGGSSREVSNKAFLIGMAKLLEDPQYHLPNTQYGDEQVSKVYHDTLIQAVGVKKLVAVYRKRWASKPIEEFIAYCDKQGIDPEIRDEVVEVCANPELSWREKALTWLMKVCLVDGPKETTNIKREAILVGIIEEPVSDWNRLRMLASEKGLVTSLRGVWALPEQKA